MAADGTLVGKGYLEVEADFSRFQEGIRKHLAKSLTPAARRAGDSAGREIALGAERSGLKQRFDKLGDRAGKALASRISKSAKPAAGDMFGLADAVKAVEGRTRRAGRAAQDFQGDMFGVNRAAKQAGRSLRDWNKGIVGAEGGVRRLRSRLRDLGYDFGSLSKGIRTSSGGFSGFDGVMARVNRGSQFFRNIWRTIRFPVIVAGIGLTAQGLSALAAGSAAAVSSLGSLSGLLVTLPAAAAVAAQAFSVLKLATAGIGDAVKAALDAEVQTGTQAVDILRQQEDAAERVADAKQNLASTERQATLASEDLRRAHEEARREMEDLRFAADEADEAIEGTAISLARAKEELARTLRDPAASGLDVREAELGVEQAENDLNRVRAEAKRAREDYRKAQDAGVKGMPRVVAAKEAERDAARAVGDAERDLERAVNDNTAAMQEQGAAASALQEKMSQLPPAGQKFVRFLVSLKPRLDALRDTSAEGFFPGAEKGLKGLLGNFKVVRGAVAKTANTLGAIAAKAGEMLGSAAWGKDLARLGELNTRILERAGGAGLNLADALRQILVAAEPFLDWLGASTLRLSEWVKGETAAGRESGRLAAFFDRTRATMERLGPILKGVGGALLNIGKAARPLGNEILDALGGAAEGWRKWTDSATGQNRLKRYFTETKPAIFEMGRLIRDAGKAFFELGRQRGVAHLLRLVRTELIPAIRDLVGVTTGWASGFLKDFGRLRDQGVPAFDAFVQVLAEHAAEAGWRIAKALVKGFINADVWGKLAIGGFLLSKFGGMSAFDRFGKNAGRKFATGFLLAVLGTELAKEIKRIVEGHKLDAPKSEEFAMYLNDYFEVDTAKIVAPNRVKLSTALGQILFNSQTEKVISVSSRKLNHLVGQIPSQFVTRFNEMRRLKDAFRDNLRPLPTIAGRSGADMRRALFPQLDELTSKGGQKADAFARRVGGSFRSLAGAARTAMENIGLNVRSMLRVLGGDAPKFNAQKALKEMPELPSMQTRQSGGFIVPGFGSGDTFRTMLPVGSFVENREAVKRLPFQSGGVVPVALEPGERVHFPKQVRRIGADVLAARNEAVPRFGFQSGGIVSVPGFPGESMNARILQPALAFLKRFNLFLTDAYGPGHDSAEHTQYGTALDVVPGPGGSWTQVGEAVAYAVQKGWNPVYYDGSHGSINLPPHGPGHHAHVTLLTAAELLSGKLAGAVSGAVGKLRKPVIEGPAGALKRVGQLAVAKVHRAATQFVGSQQGAMEGLRRHSGAGALEAEGNGAGLMRKISANRGWNFADWWELDERETGHGADTYNEDSGASLRAQFLPMNFGKYGPGSDPSQNPSMGEQIMSMARYIAERYGNPTAALAHHDSTNWYQQGGLVGMQKGGLLSRLVGGMAQRLAIGGGVNINRRFREAMYPGSDWSSLPELSFPIAAALAEAAGDWAGTDMPGITMAQMSKGEGGLKPGSSGDDNGDGKPDGYGWLAITRPFGDEYGVQKFGGYQAMLNPVLNAAVAARMYGARGLAPWYGDSHVTDTNAHYTGDYDIRNSLGGKTFGEAIGEPSAGEGGAGGAGGKETIPATYKGAKTGNLAFGPLPKNLAGVNQEIAKWNEQAPVYRKAKRFAAKSGKPSVAEAIGRNLEKIEHRLAALTRLRTRLRLDKIRKALGKRIGRALGRFGNYEQLIEGSQIDYEKASQFAEQVVGLEPQSPELPNNASDTQRQKAESDYVARFRDYVETQERPAYGTVLEKVAGWRNTILRAEKFGFGPKQPSVAASQTRWEAEVRSARSRIAAIERFSKAVAERLAAFRKGGKDKALPEWLRDQLADRNKMRGELPALRLRDARLSGAILQARERFFPGGNNRLDELPEGKPVQIPLPGSGTFEGKLREVQGIYDLNKWHELLPASALAPPRQPGRFGGVIWELQGTIEELGLKISQAANGIADGSGGGEGGDDSELVSILREIAERERKGRFISERLRSTTEGFDAFYGDLPKFHSGGVTPGPAGREFPALLKGHETVRTAEQEVALADAIQGLGGAAGAPVVDVDVIIHGTIVSDLPDPVETVIRDPRTKRVIQRTRGGRITSGGARR